MLDRDGRATPLRPQERAIMRPGGHDDLFIEMEWIPAGPNELDRLTKQGPDFTKLIQSQLLAIHD
jgi:hypothetical protein